MKAIPYLPGKENPRWTRCAAAIGRRPEVWEFMLWNSRCWREFHAWVCGPGNHRECHLLAVPAAHNLFDLWQHAEVEAGRWSDVPGESVEGEARRGA